MNHDLPPRYRHLVAMVLLLLALSTTGFAATLELSGPAGASVVVNGVGMGFLPLTQPLTLPPGLYEIRSELPGYLPFATTVHLVEVTDWQRLQIRPVPMSKKTAWSSNILFAGMGQHYIGKSAKGYIFNIVEAGGLLTALAGEIQRSNDRKDYLLHQSKYESAINPNDILFYKDLSKQAYSDMEDSEKLRDTGLMVAGGAIVLSIVDILLFFPSIEGGVGETPLQTGLLDSDSGRPDFFQENSPLKSVHAGLKLSF
jgi:PEGA domain